ncbi:hypothetical protein QFZ42_003300 [Variovorax paradoxus]|uniref:hypothetical protein n=1 Tax=Variovorax paradoxus TaxID=34073 RepID=UPI0027944BB6|nr:hypothetical protein [Variovorax paradoxus]MDQ0571466.1 hypothetical protein [Variovorax paradoxus]
MTTAIKVSQFTPELDRIYSDARWHCDKYGVESEAGFRQVMGVMAHKAFRNAIEPFLKMKCQITALHIPRYVLHADGKFESLPQELSPEEKKLWDQLDEMIANEASRYKLLD